METVTLPRQEYEDLIDARDHAVAMRDVKTGVMETLSEAEVAAYLQAVTPLVIWRQETRHDADSSAGSTSVNRNPILHSWRAGQGVRRREALYAKFCKATEF